MKRLDVRNADISISNKNAVKRVNFSPFPGVTLGATYYSRGLRKVSNESWDSVASAGGIRRFLGALAPGIGINVTFMNFGDPRDLAHSTMKCNRGRGALGVRPAVSRQAEGRGEWRVARGA